MKVFFRISVSPFLQATKALRESRGIALLCFYTSALEGGESSASRPCHILPPGKTRYPLYRRLGGPQCWSGHERKISPPLGFDPRTVQSVVSRYTVWGTRPTVFVEAKLFQGRRSDKKRSWIIPGKSSKCRVLFQRYAIVTLLHYHKPVSLCDQKLPDQKWSCNLKSENVIKWCLDVAVLQRRKRCQINVEERLMIIGRRKSKQLWEKRALVQTARPPQITSDVAWGWETGCLWDASH
jgi:hypothetical protein